MLHNIYQLLQTLRKDLEPSSGLAGAEHEAWWMLEAITGMRKMELLSAGDIEFSREQQQQLSEWVAQRVHDKKPLQYILGSVPFLDLDIAVRLPILIPRQETEEWVGWLCDKLSVLKNHKLNILDMCTGTGCIALMLAHAFPQSFVTGVDISGEACKLAQENKERNGVTNVTFVQSDLFNALPTSSMFDIIVSNPPYITENEYENLEQEVRLWEDRGALVAGDDGLLFYKKIAQYAQTHLKYPNALSALRLPQIIVELGNDAEGVKKIFLDILSCDVELYKDMFGAVRWAAVYLTDKFV